LDRDASAAGTAVIELERLNALPTAEFVSNLDGIFEHSPWVAQRAAARRPFVSRLDLLDAMRSVVAEATPPEQTALICAHPQLGSRGRNPGGLTVASAREQRRAGLQACTPEDFARLDALNSAYLDRFAMPFILAVRGHDPESIIATFAARLGNEPALERRTALREIGLIAGYRLADAVATPASALMTSMINRLSRVRLAGVGSEAATSLIREWLLSLDLDVTTDELGQVIGRRHGSMANPTTLFMGVSWRPDDCRVQPDGDRSVVLAIAVLQQIRHLGLALPYDLAIFAPSAERGVDDGGMGAVPPFGGPLVAITEPGFGPRAFAAPLSRQTAAPADSVPEPQLLEGAVRNWVDFLINDQGTA